MKNYCALIGLFLAGAPALPAGTIVGTVAGQGIEATGSEDGGKYGSRRYKFVERVDYDRLTDFVVYIDEVMPGPDPLPEVSMVQRDAAFEPRVLPVMVGTRVRWPNEDDIYHNVFSMTETKEFNLGLYSAKEPPPTVTFDRPGRVDVFCSIHAKMHGIVLVLPSPYFAVADLRGRFVIRDVPAGTYRLRAWHERLPGATQEITVPAEGEVRVDFMLGLAGLPKP